MYDPEPPRPPRPGAFLALLWGLVVLAYGVAFFLASGTSLGRTLENVGGGSATGWDKVLHATGFFLLGLLLFQFFMTVQGVWRRSVSPFLPAAVTLLLGSAYAGIHESGQALFPGLVPEASDVLADIAGLALAVLLYALWWSTERRLFQIGREASGRPWRGRP